MPPELDLLTAETWRQSADEPTADDTDDSTTDESEAFWILDELAASDGLPAEAIRAADAHRADMAPVFIELVEQYLAGETQRSLGNALFFIFHMLGSWREKSAYRPLAKLLRRPADEIELHIRWRNHRDHRIASWLPFSMAIPNRSTT